MDLGDRRHPGVDGMGWSDWYDLHGHRAEERGDGMERAGEGGGKRGGVGEALEDTLQRCKL